MHLGQTQVQNQQIEFVVGHQSRVGFAATGHVVHRSTRTSQSAQQTVSKHLLVFGYQNAHGCLLLMCGRDGWPVRPVILGGSAALRGAAQS
jgi:hypothetical protein